MSTPASSASCRRSRVPYYRNFYGGKRHLGYRHPNQWHEINKTKFYQGYHFFLDVF